MKFECKACADIELREMAAIREKVAAWSAPLPEVNSAEAAAEYERHKRRRIDADKELDEVRCLRREHQKTPGCDGGTMTQKVHGGLCPLPTCCWEYYSYFTA